MVLNSINRHKHISDLAKSLLESMLSGSVASGQEVDPKAVVATAIGCATAMVDQLQSNYDEWRDRME